MEITKDMLIKDIIYENPDVLDKFMFIGLGCACCPASMMETLEETAMVHGLDIDEMLEFLNSDEEIIF